MHQCRRERIHHGTALSYGQPLQLTTSAAARAALSSGWVLQLDGATIGSGSGYPDTFSVAAPEALGLHALAVFAMNNQNWSEPVAVATFMVVPSVPAWPIPGGLSVSPQRAPPGASLHITTSADARAALESSWLLRLDGATIGTGSGIPDGFPVHAPTAPGMHTLAVFYVPQDGPIDSNRPVAVASFRVG